MENDLFDWEDWDLSDTCQFTFCDITLKVKIDNFEPGTKFSTAIIDTERGALELWPSPEGIVAYRYKLSYTVGERI